MTIESKYPITYPTVDVAVIDQSAQKVLLGRKPDQVLWRFPGGFVDFADASLETAASRELQEETGLKANSGSLRYLGSAAIADPRYAGDASRRILSSFFGLDTTNAVGAAIARDDLAEVRFFPFSDLQKVLVPEHRPLAQYLR